MSKIENNNRKEGKSSSQNKLMMKKCWKHQKMTPANPSPFKRESKTMYVHIIENAH